MDIMPVCYFLGLEIWAIYTLDVEYFGETKSSVLHLNHIERGVYPGGAENSGLEGQQHVLLSAVLNAEVQN